MKKVVSILTMILCSFATNAFCAQGPMPLRVKTMKRDITFYVTPQTTIKEIKEVIHDEEGIPVDQQRLTKSEGWTFQAPRWSFAFPFKKLTTCLEDGQTCGQYDLQRDQHIHLHVKLPKSLAQIAAEVQARRTAITAALLQKPFSQPLVTLVTAYDTHNPE